MDTITVSKEVFANYLGLNSTELTTALIVEKDGVKTPKPQSEIDSFISSRLTDKVKNVGSRKKEEGQGWARKEALGEVEKYLSETFGISEGNWKERLESIKNKPNGPTSELTDDAIKNSTFFKASIKQLKEELVKEREQHEETKKSHRLKHVSSIADQKALSILRDPKNKFQLPQDKKLAEKWENMFLAELKSGGYQLSLDDNNNPILKDKDGNPAQDRNFTDISFETFAKETAKSIFQVSTAEPRLTPPNNDGSPSTPATGVPTFKSKEEADKFLDEALSNPTQIKEEVLESVKKQLANFEN